MRFETIALGVSTTIIGMGIVFLVLILLSVIIWLLAAVVEKNEQSRKGGGGSAPAPATGGTPEAVQAGAGISAKTTAAIMGAISAATGRPLSQLHFTAIRRAGTAANTWAMHGAAEIMANRQTFL